MFSANDAQRITGRWVRMTRPNPDAATPWTYIGLVQRAWLSGTRSPTVGIPVDGSLGLMMFEPNTTVPFTSFHLPADGSYHVLPGCADVPIRRPYCLDTALMAEMTVCPTRSGCTCIARWEL
jgi:hypothetical protein